MPIVLLMALACASKAPPVAAAPVAPRAPITSHELPAPPRSTPTPESRESLVRRAIEAQSGQLAWCYESRLKASPGLSGRLELGWEVVAGKVVDVEVTRDSVRDAQLTDCALAKVARWRFPAGADGEVTWPFVFAPR